MRRPLGGGSGVDGKSCQTSRAGTAIAAHPTAAGRRHRGSRWSASRATGVPSSTHTALPEPIWANGILATSPAHAAM